MEYGPFSFARDGVSPVLETIPAGMVLSTGLPQYTTGDLDGIMRLYAHAPSPITVDTNPSGLQVIVDGTPCTAPCVFTTWTTGSQHTLSVPLDANNQTLQVLNQQNYIFGRWNAVMTGNCPTTVTVTNSLGNGTLLSPSTEPAITNYLASFIPVHPYNPVVAPGGDGTITSSPPPSSLIINGAPTNYYQDRQLITMTVNPNPGWNLYFWYNLPGFSLYANPYTFSVTTDLDYLNYDSGYPVTAGLYNDAVTTIKAASPDISAAGTYPGFAIQVVDGNGNINTAYTPRNYDGSGDGSGFASGANLTLCASALNGSSCPGTAVAQSPVTANISYLFNNWSGAKSASTDGLSVTVPASAGQSLYTANYTPSFRSMVFTSQSCGGNEVTAVLLLRNELDRDQRKSRRVLQPRHGEFHRDRGKWNGFPWLVAGLFRRHQPASVPGDGRGDRDSEFQYQRDDGSTYDYERFPCHSHCHQRGRESHGQRYGIHDEFLTHVHLPG